MKKLWKKYRAAILAVVSGIVGFDIGEAWNQARTADEPSPAVTVEQTTSTAPAQEKEADAHEPDAVALPSGSATSAHDDAVDYSALDWCCGGFSAKNAKPVDGVEIANLKVSSNGMSYSWKSGGCEKLGASSKTDASCLACLFCKVNGKWVGGKFDWISTSRTTRDFANINGSYNGWNPKALTSAKEYAFVIVGKDGKKRSNVITCGR